MDWVAILIVGCAVVALSLGAYKVAQSPAWWAGMATHVFHSTWPTIKKVVFKPETPEDRAARQLAERRGEDWNPATKRPKER